MPPVSQWSIEPSSLDENERTGDVLGLLLAQSKQWAGYTIDQLSHWMPSLIFGSLCLLTALLLARRLSKNLSSLMAPRLDETLGRFIANLSFYAMLTFAMVVVLPLFGIPLSGVTAVLASAAFAIAFALQGTLSNISAGMLLLLLRPFKIGDFVQLGAVLGKVNEIDLFTTTLDTFDNRRVILPNASIVAGTIENISFHPNRRIDVTVGIEYSASLDATRGALTEAVQAIGDRIVLGEGKGHKIVLTNFADSSVEWTLRVWVRQEDFFQAREDLLVEMKKSLDSANIGIPYPQLRVHMSSVDSVVSVQADSTISTGEINTGDGTGRTDLPYSSDGGELRADRIRPRARERSTNEKIMKAAKPGQFGF